MKIKYIILLVSIILVGFISFRTISFFTEGRSFYFKHTNSTDLSNESFGKVRLHDNIHSPSFLERYGVPLNREDNNLYDYYHWRNGIETASIITGKEKGEIVRLIIGEVEEYVKKNNLQTAKGIIIGSTKQDVLSVYGSHYYKRTEQGVDIIGYVDQKQHVTLEFWLVEDGKVAEIRLDDSNME
ncbi:hypothetical protein J7E76_27550 [Bacillus sp. ISL-101]|uniref:hypothetical protein n=1 Tax=unclassified Bacillus (in: firmicutes) TaxID=185979 RepID=UPI001BEC834E|nr:MULTISPECIES: hypothetical protein [unclassified Bacillus (in: firmicutes)]MBT2632780.1 hypothetical protein [Bacillus sp. ISL-101]MBT2714971.1 hypothetical protein [Bacillus sp. ISL-57]